MKIGELDVSKIYLGGSEISKIMLGTSQVYSGDTPTPPAPVPYSGQYLTIESTSDNNTIYWKKRASNIQGKTISASTDNGSTWAEYTSTSGNGITIVTLNSGDKLLIKGENATYYESWNPQGIFGSTSSFIVYGNTMSLIYGDNFAGQTTLTSGYTFDSLFSQCSGLASAENLILPATTLTIQCYQFMFGDCTSLTTAPELPATTLAQYCYSNMFNGCTSLTTAPELPATTLADWCYFGMFQGCTSLTTAPELPATILAEGCYGGMFEECTSLTTAPNLPATTLANYCYSSMFRGCTSLTTAPELPATTLASNCYWYMFYSCTSLNYIKCLATDISADMCTFEWVTDVASTGTFVKAASMNDWTTGEDGIPDGWTVQDDAE